MENYIAAGQHIYIYEMITQNIVWSTSLLVFRDGVNERVNLWWFNARKDLVSTSVPRYASHNTCSFDVSSDTT